MKEVGLWNYVRHPSTDVWCMAWAIGDEDPLLWTPKSVLPVAVEGHVRLNGYVYAHNAPFELAVWNEILVPRYGWPVLQSRQTHCTMAMAYAMGLPGALEDAALALGLHVLKDAEGRALMLRMARPRRVDYLREVDARGEQVAAYTWWDEPEKLKRLYAYCQQDVRVERELHKRLVPLSDTERKVWLMDHAINTRGVRVDLPSARAAIRLVEIVKERCDAELGRVTGGAVQSATALPALKEWLAEQGVKVDSLAKQDLADLLARNDLSDPVRRALTLRSEAGKASAAKLNPMVLRAGEDDRVRYTTQYHAAATGRWGGRGIQPHNLPRDVPPPATVEKILGLMRAGKVDAIDMLYGPPMTVLSRCLRGFFVPADECALIGGDFSNVEGRGVAWFSGEEWKLSAFREADAGTGPGIYELSASRILGVRPDQITKEQRQAYGKVPELALGYQGGVGAFQTMAKTYGVKIADTEAARIRDGWRAAHPRVKRTWYALQQAAIAAVRTPGEVFPAGHPGREAKFKVAGSFLWCLLPSRRALCYPYPRVLEGEFGPQLTYMAVPSPEDKKKGRIIHDPKNSSNWARVATYGGSLMENIIQAICRDLLAYVMLRLHDAGARIVLHVHDEVVIEVSLERAVSARGEMERLMREPPAWAKGFPLYAECEIMRRYGK